MPRAHLSGYRDPHQEEVVSTDDPRLMTMTGDVDDAEHRTRREDPCLPIAGFDFHAPSQHHHKLLVGSRVPGREIPRCSPEVPEALGVLKRRGPHGLRLGIPYGLLPWECLISKMGDTGVVCIEFRVWKSP